MINKLYILVTVVMIYCGIHDYREWRGLNPVEIVKSGDQFPRDFNITESDDYLVCAHQEGKQNYSFKRTTNTGKLTPTDNQQIAPEGAC